MNVLEALQHYPDDALGQMCAAANLTELADRVVPTSRARAIEQLRRAWAKPDHVARALRQIGPVEAAVLEKLLADGGQAESVELRAWLAQRGVHMRPSSATDEADPNYIGSPRFEDALARAALFGLVCAAQPVRDEDRPFALGRSVLIPDPIRELLKAHRGRRPNPVAGEARAAPAPEAALVKSVADFQGDLGRYWRYARKHGELRVTAQSWIYKSDFKRVLAALNAPADAPSDEASNSYAWFLRRMLTQLGALEATPSGLGISATERGDSFLRQPVAERARSSFEAWRDAGLWNELTRIGLPYEGLHPHRAAPDRLTSARESVLRWLARAACDANGAPALDKWLSVDDLIESIKSDDYQFLFPRAFRDTRYFAHAFSRFDRNTFTPYHYASNAYGVTFDQILDEAQGWDLVERPFIKLVLIEPLHWMGLLDLSAPSAASQPLQARLTDAGAWLLNLADQPNFVESGGRVLVQPNFTVIAMQPISDTVLAELDQFAELQGGDRATHYHLTRHAVYRAQRGGWNANKIIGFLEQHQGGPLPANVRRSLEDWQQQHSRIAFHRGATLVQYADDDTRHALREVLGEGVAARLGGQFDLAASPDAEGVLAPLREAGWAPLVSGASAPDLEGSLRVAEDGTIAFRHRVVNVFALSKVAGLAEQGERHAWRVTPESVRAALSRGASVDEILATLAQLADGALPPKLTDDVRAWANFYGAARVQEIALIELDNAEVLKNALNDKVLGRYLTPIEGSARPLALAARGDLHRVKELLAERGITLAADTHAPNP